ncbi:thiamine-phosphate kinase [Anaerosinus massiliensis]|uniref:thiamine-phosphate kinase n=1 Tax=Massilibacillus massiliensis TaxID=1806837 RepID=UPI000AD90C86|nr:thiamine-phosphate kinase [Massilibacillus massiliensis]
MELKDVGEFGFIDLIKEGCIVNQENVVVGIGDDAAVIKPTPGRLQLISTDMLMEGVHFDLAFMSPFQLGYKSIAVNLSDIAAMGGVPKQLVISIALPKKISMDVILEIYRGMKALAHRFHVNIIGGDTIASSGGIVINVTVMGEVCAEKLQKRSGAQLGDLVAVTGSLGNSAAGLALLQAGGFTAYDFSEPLIQSHLMPLPQIDMANHIAEYAHSMNDISDGLASEASEIASASQIGLRLYEEKIPLTQELIQASRILGKSALEFALYGGEDYQLIFTIAPEKYALLSKCQMINSITIIGEVTKMHTGVELVQRNQEIARLEPKGYNHFR